MHRNSQDCPRCRFKLIEAHIAMVDWFNWIKGLFPDAHVSWSFRNEKTQNLMVKTGKSRLAWPNSKHNFSQDGQPCSKALDLFRLDDVGVAKFEKPWFEKIYRVSVENNFPIRWGGNFKSFADSDHFELGDINAKST